MRGFFLAFLLSLGIGAGWLAPVHEAGAFKLPNYATSSNVEAEIQAKGKKITDTVALVAGILCILALAVGAGYLPFNRERGNYFLIGGGVGLLLLTLIYGIAGLLV